MAAKSQKAELSMTNYEVALTAHKHPHNRSDPFTFARVLCHLNNGVHSKGEMLDMYPPVAEKIYKGELRS